VAACRRLRCEQLESRSLLSVTITGTVTGTYTAAAYDFECGGQVDMPSSVSTGTDVTVGGGTTLDLGNEPFAVGTLTLLDGSVVDGSLSAGAYDLQNGTLSASLGGDGAVTVDGYGTVLLNAEQNTYSGGTAVESGILEALTPAALPGYDTPNSSTAVAAGAGCGERRATHGILRRWRGEGVAVRLAA
jgi:autotransporter-associated beta strand protein